jgi:hypothetical protein
MSVRITFLAEPPEPSASGEETAAVLVPRAAIRSDAGGAYAWVVTGGRLRRQPLETAGERGDQTVVAKGLAGGEALVVSSDVEDLRDGRAVEISE